MWAIICLFQKAAMNSLVCDNSAKSCRHRICMRMDGEQHCGCVAHPDEGRATVVSIVTRHTLARSGPTTSRSKRVRNHLPASPAWVMTRDLGMAYCRDPGQGLPEVSIAAGCIPASGFEER